MRMSALFVSIIVTVIIFGLTYVIISKVYGLNDGINSIKRKRRN